MTRRLPLLAHGLNLALFGALLGPSDRPRAPGQLRREIERYEPRRHRRPAHDPDR